LLLAIALRIPGRKKRRVKERGKRGEESQGALATRNPVLGLSKPGVMRLR
jgi:hypothetical protein